MDRPKKYSKIVQFSFILTFYLYVFYFYAKPIIANKQQDQTSQEFHSRKQFYNYFFTGWNFLAQICYLTLAILDELTDLFTFPYLPESKKIALKTLRSYLFNTIIFPCAVLVCCLFWCLYLIDMELVCPQCDKFYPYTLNHTVHSVIIFPIVLELGLPTEHYPVKFKIALTILTIFVVTYMILFFGIYFIYNLWLYPVFERLNCFQALLFLSVLYVSLVELSYFGVNIQNSTALENDIEIKNN